MISIKGIIPFSHKNLDKIVNTAKNNSTTITKSNVNINTKVNANNNSNVETLDLDIETAQENNKIIQTDYLSTGLNNDSLEKTLSNSKSKKLPESNRGLSLKKFEDISDIGNNISSPQYEFRHYSNIKFEEDTGIGYIDIDGLKYYTVAMAPYYGKPGDKFIIKLVDGDKIKYMNVIIADQKDSLETKKNNYMYHGMSTSELSEAKNSNSNVKDDANILEFIGDEEKIRSAIVKNIHGNSIEDSTGNCNDLGGIFKGKIQGINYTGKYNFKRYKWVEDENVEYDGVHNGYWDWKEGYNEENTRVS